MRVGDSISSGCPAAAAGVEPYRRSQLKLLTLDRFSFSHLPFFRSKLDKPVRKWHRAVEASQRAISARRSSGRMCFMTRGNGAVMVPTG